MDDISAEIERQRQRQAFAYQRRAQADEDIRESQQIIEALQWSQAQQVTPSEGRANKE